MKPIFAVIVFFGLVGCVPEPPQDMCGAGGLQTLLGQDRSVLSTMRFAVPIRIIEFNQAVTMDFNPNRLNILLDRAGVISRVWCG